MPADDRIQIQTLVKRLLDGQAERVELSRTRTLDAVEYRLERWKQNTTDGPVTIPFGLLSTVHFLHVRGEYQNADPANNIEKFDPAAVEIQLNDALAPFISVYAVTLEGPVTHLAVRINAAVAQDLRVTLILGAAG